MVLGKELGKKWGGGGGGWGGAQEGELEWGIGRIRGGLKINPTGSGGILNFENHQAVSY